jgi:tRNA(Ile)-lysidine synthase
MSKKKSKNYDKRTQNELKEKIQQTPLSQNETSNSQKSNLNKNYNKLNKKNPKFRIQNSEIRIQKSILSHDQKSEPFLKDFYSRLKNYLENTLYIEDKSEILIAVSGGIDSVVLLDAMCVLSEKHNYKLIVAHFNHSLRGKASNEDEIFVRHLAENYKLPFHHSKGKVKQFAEKNSNSIEQAARILRYLFFERTARSIHSSLVATAHTADDSAETFLMNLIRGTGLTGLSGIPEKRPLSKNVSIIRPFLFLKKQDLKEYARLRNLSWREDESNSLLNFTRNKIRHELLPKLVNDFSPAIVDIINRTSKLFNGADEFIDEYVKNAVSDILTDKGSDRFSINIPLLQTFSEFIQGEIIQSALNKHFQMQPLSLQTIDRILDLQNSPVGSICEIMKQAIVLRDRQQLIFSRTRQENKCNMLIERTGVFKAGRFRLTLSEVNKKKVKFALDPKIEYFDMDLLPIMLTLRNWRDGDTFQPLGMAGTVKVSDYLTNEKIPLIDKPNVLVLSTKSDIVWICGKRASDKFKVTESTKKYIKAVFEEI